MTLLYSLLTEMFALPGTKHTKFLFSKKSAIQACARSRKNKISGITQDKTLKYITQCSTRAMDSALNPSKCKTDTRLLGALKPWQNLDGKISCDIQRSWKLSVVTQICTPSTLHLTTLWAVYLRWAGSHAPENFPTFDCRLNGYFKSLDS